MALGDNLVAVALIAIAAFTVGYLIAQTTADGKLNQLNFELKDTKSTAAGLATGVSIATQNAESCSSKLQECQNRLNSRTPGEVP